MQNNKNEIILNILLSLVLSSMIFIAKIFLVGYESYIYMIYMASCIGFYILIVNGLSFIYKKKYSQIDLINTIVYKKNTILFNHYLLPILLVIVLPLFLFFSDHYRSLIFVGVLSFFVFFLYFTNIRAFFKNNLKFERKTHFIYDLLNILNYIFFIYVILSFSYYFGVKRELGILFLVLSELFFYFICFTRYFEKFNKRLFIIGLVLIVFNVLMILLFDFSFLKTLILTIGSYSNFIIFTRKLHSLGDYPLSKRDYSEGLLIQIFSLGFALII